jgi:hypothetical protein
MQLNEQVHAITHDFAHLVHIADGIAHFLDVRLEVNLVIAFIEKRIQVAECIKAHLHLRLTFHQDLLDAAFVKVPIDTGGEPSAAATVAPSGRRSTVTWMLAFSKLTSAFSLSRSAMMVGIMERMAGSSMRIRYS